MKKPLFLISLALTFMLMILSCEKDDTDSTSDNTNDENSKEETNQTFIDSRDSTVYKWVKIGDQVWMAENLKATQYSDGTAITLVTDNKEWKNLDDNNVDKAYCWYDDDEATNKDLYGALYTYAAATNGDSSGTNVQGVCPNGWHLPSDAEWTTLTDELGGESVAGDKLKASDGWNDLIVDGNGSDDYGFAALPGGGRSHSYGTFTDAGWGGNWWSSTESNASIVWGRNMNHDDAEVTRKDYFKSGGFSVRCVKD